MACGYDGMLPFPRHPPPCLLSDVRLRDKACIMVTHDDRMAQRAGGLVEILDGAIVSAHPVR